MNSASVFSPRVLIGLVASLVLIFAASMLLSISGGGGEGRADSVGANSYSRSAIGYAGFYEMLERQGKEVVRSQSDTLAKLEGNRGLLVLAEPDRNIASDELRNKIYTARNLLIVLPKWRGHRDPARTEWLDSAQLLPDAVAQAVLGLVAAEGEIVRVDSTRIYQPSLLDHDPHLEGTRQLIAKSKLLPLISTPDGILLGQIIDGSQKILVLSDPDVIANHGIGKFSNAALALDMVELLAKDDAPVVFDETVHGFVSNVQPPLRLFWGFPYNLVGLQALVGVAILLLATTARFGVPQVLKPALGTGKRMLIANSALLLDFGGHHREVLRRYCDVALRDAARQMRAPRGLQGLELMAWLDRAASARGLEDNASSLIGKSENVSGKNLPRLFAAARSIYFWKKEMLHGPQGRPHDY